MKWKQTALVVLLFSTANLAALVPSDKNGSKAKVLLVRSIAGSSGNVTKEQSLFGGSQNRFLDRRNNLTDEEKKNVALNNFRQLDGSKSDSEVAAHLENVKVWKKKKNDLAKLQITKDNNQTIEVKMNPIYDNKTDKPVPKSIAKLNERLDDYLDSGDIAISPEQLAARSAETEKGSSGARIKRANPQKIIKWPTADKGVIAYRLNSKLPAFSQKVIIEAMQFWEDNICVNFEPATSAHKKGLSFTHGDGCWSYLGMVGGFQTVSIGSGCETFGTAAHEIGHALGFEHEQQRYDRDTYIQINTRYIEKTPQDSVAQFTKSYKFMTATLTSPYDYGSIMHYDGDSFTSKEGYPTMTARDRRYQQTMGQNKGPSFYDIRELNNLYGCNAICASSTTACQNAGYPNPKNCSECKCPLGFGGALCDTLATSENMKCGRVLTATTAMKSLTASVGTSTATDAEQTCYWHIKSAAGTLIEVTVTHISAYCMAGCWFSALELKMGLKTGIVDGINVTSPFEGSGFRFCCVSDNLNVAYTSITNLVIVIGFGNDNLRFTIKYRQVAE